MSPPSKQGEVAAKAADGNQENKSKCLQKETASNVDYREEWFQKCGNVVTVLDVYSVFDRSFNSLFSRGELLQGMPIYPSFWLIASVPFKK